MESPASFPAPSYQVRHVHRLKQRDHRHGRLHPPCEGGRPLCLFRVNLFHRRPSLSPYLLISLSPYLLVSFLSLHPSRGKPGREKRKLPSSFFKRGRKKTHSTGRIGTLDRPFALFLFLFPFYGGKSDGNEGQPTLFYFLEDKAKSPGYVRALFFQTGG